MVYSYPSFVSLEMMPFDQRHEFSSNTFRDVGDGHKEMSLDHVMPIICPIVFLEVDLFLLDREIRYWLFFVCLCLL